MPELSLSVQLTRNLLALAPLEINDHLNYFVAAEFWGGQATWNRQQVTSPFMDGAVTTNRTLSQINEEVVVECIGADQAELDTNIFDLLTAAKQDNFRMVITKAGQVSTYQCEAADFQVSWQGPRMIAHQIQVRLSIPRQPILVNGQY